MLQAGDLSLSERALALRNVLSKLEAPSDAAEFRAEVIDALRLLAGDILDQFDAYADTIPRPMHSC